MSGDTIFNATGPLIALQIEIASFADFATSEFAIGIPMDANILRHSSSLLTVLGACIALAGNDGALVANFFSKVVPK